MVKLTFVTLDVFTTTPYKGNPLAIVHLPYGTNLTQERKHQITKEFNLSETVFLHEPEVTESNHGEIVYAGKDVKIDIWTIAQELPFAGHPTVGTSWYILGGSNATRNGDANGALLTLSGRIPISLDATSNYSKITVPHAFTVFPEVNLSTSWVGKFLGLATDDGKSILPNDVAASGVAVVAVVKGLAFLLVQVASVDVLGRLKGPGQRITPGSIGLGKDQAETFCAAYVYCVTEESDSIVKIRTRMFEGLFEDPATGSAASCLGGYLSMRSSLEVGVHTKYEITQAVEMGRQSDISVEVVTKAGEGKEGKKAVDQIWLSGSAVEVMRGTINVD